MTSRGLAPSTVLTRHSPNYNAESTSSKFSTNVATSAPPMDVTAIASSCPVSVAANTCVQFANSARNKSQFQTEILYSLISSRSVRTNPVAASKRKSNKEVDVEQKKCRICSSIKVVYRGYNVERVCRSCQDFFKRHSLEEIQSFFPCVEATKSCDIKFIEGKYIRCLYCRFMKCLDAGMTKRI